MVPTPPASPPPRHVSLHDSVSCLGRARHRLPPNGSTGLPHRVGPHFTGIPPYLLHRPAPGWSRRVGAGRRPRSGRQPLPDSPPNIVGVAFVVLTGRVQCRFGGHIWSDRAEDRPWAMSMWVYSAYAPPIVAVVRPKKAWPGLATRLSRLQPLLYAGPLMPGTARQLSRISSAVP